MAALQDAHAIEAAYRRHGAVVLRRARQLLGNEHDARELVQEIFLSLLAKPEQFDGRSTLTTWLYSATTHRCLNRIRDRRTRARLLEEHVAAPGSAAVPARAERLVLLDELLASLPDEIAQAAVYYYVDEMTHDEIASVIGCSRRHVGNLLARLQDLTRTEAACQAR